ncbi:MAG: hypothetical protein WCQ96_00365 [Patescibacteria group bacterium]
MARELGISSEEFLAKTLQTAQRFGIKGEVLETISYIHQIVTIPREKERKEREQRRTEELARFEAAKNMQN